MHGQDADLLQGSGQPLAAVAAIVTTAAAVVVAVVTTAAAGLSWPLCHCNQGTSKGLTSPSPYSLTHSLTPALKGGIYIIHLYTLD